MKRKRKIAGCFGFTLLELLVVMVIIAVLAGLLLPAINRARYQAKLNQTRATAKALETAIQAYRHEYSVWPCNDPSAGGVWSNDNSQVVHWLLPQNNARHISFWPDSTSVMDAFGAYYTVKIDVINDTVTIISPNP